MSDPQTNTTVQAVTVDIYDQTYHLRGQDPEYIRRLADMVDAKMRMVASQGKTVDSLRVAVLAALNIADELSSLRESYDELTGRNRESGSSLRTRAHSLAGLLDEVLSEERRIG
ncbi:cell division protein ZapA [Paracidobacterium acidisoli]|uniref:Cell division protein ZapA n=1 Tax=Paracidobacterium acidisoli TaxID=2303751 RepID=A0A372IMN4_9BACT|nr:cell division protein ZapA [Paracidobacterium acidisoli]MBT9332457.1 cell division protein ZapA [Paracidobacterium acidisoli]